MSLVADPYTDTNINANADANTDVYPPFVDGNLGYQIGYPPAVDSSNMMMTNADVHPPAVDGSMMALTDNYPPAAPQLLVPNKKQQVPFRVSPLFFFDLRIHLK